jgi:oligopeptidase A
VGLSGEPKEKFNQIQQSLAELSTQFSNHVLDATKAFSLMLTQPEEIAGLPPSLLSLTAQSARDAARENAKLKGHESDEAPVWRFTLQAPSLIPVLTYAESDALRKEVWTAYNTLCRAEPQDNRLLVREILELRHEFAQLIGKANFADLVTERRMVGSGQAALKFSEDLHDRVEVQFHQEAEALRQFKADSTGNSPSLLEPWESGYWAEKQRKAHYDFDEEALRPYFPIDRVISGMFELAQKIFQLRIKEVEVETWHPEVKFYELFDDANQHRGSFYADWHPRESKRGGAWMNYLITGNRAPGSASTPHLGLICGNLTPSVGGKTALLNHREVETIFHEFGHLLHHLCGDVEVKALNGVNVPWDFVELPSQIMENWCWERESLDLFARHHETGEPIPEELFDKMLAARNYMKASANMRQLAMGKMDLNLHITWPIGKKPDLDDFVEEKLASYSAQYATKPKSNLFNFSHLFSSPTGYASGYYSYKWAEVLDADAFTRFQKEGILNPDTGRDFRAKILAKGNSEDPAKLFQDFMGRDPDPEALLRRDGLIGSVL